MTQTNPEWAAALVHLLALASRLEGEGQYNLAKLARAAADGLARQAAWQLPVPAEKNALATEVVQVAAALPELGLSEDLAAALRRGAAAMAGGRLALIDETPHPYVCRTCGWIALGEPGGNCPRCGARSGTFQWFPPVYWLQAFEPPEALATLRRTPQEVDALLAGLPEELLARPPDDGGWSIRHAVTHLRDAQAVLDYRLELFREEEHPTLESKAVFEWATQEETRPPATRAIFDDYRATRAAILDRLERLPLEDWWRTGRHAEFGVVSLKQQVSYFTAHELTHLPQIERLRAQFSG